jgi:hypothetical protein
MKSRKMSKQPVRSVVSPRVGVRKIRKKLPDFVLSERSKLGGNAKATSSGTSKTWMREFYLTPEGERILKLIESGQIKMEAK